VKFSVYPATYFHGMSLTLLPASKNTLVFYHKLLSTGGFSEYYRPDLSDTEKSYSIPYFSSHSGKSSGIYEY